MNRIANRILACAMATLFLGCSVKMNHAISDRSFRLLSFLDETIEAGRYPGIQYIVVDSAQTVFQYFGGWADIQNRNPMQSGTTMMAYSMTKTFTAAAILQLVQNGKIGLDDSVYKYFPAMPYSHSMTIRHLLAQTSGIPNPVPLRWVHLAQLHASFNEDEALAKVLEENSEPQFPPGSKYGYSNISYWLLGKIIERISGEQYPVYMQKNIFTPLGLSPTEIGYTIPVHEHHAKGYLKKFSLMNLAKSFLIGKEFIGEYEEGWLHINDHHLNGAGFGGLIVSARGVSLFLQDQLRAESAIMNKETQSLFFSRQSISGGEATDMTLGWHIGNLDGEQYYYKEGGGGGYHAEMRVYLERRIASVIMVNETSSDCTDLQSILDMEFIKNR